MINPDDIKRCENTPDMFNNTDEIWDFVEDSVNMLMRDENLTIDQASKRITFIYKDKEINLFDYSLQKLSK